MSVPPTRSLPAVLRQQLAPRQIRHLVVATCGNVIAAPAGNAYADVIVNGQHVTVPKLSGARFVSGAPAYLFTSGDFMLYLGCVTTS